MLTRVLDWPDSPADLPCEFRRVRSTLAKSYIFEMLSTRLEIKSDKFCYNLVRTGGEMVSGQTKKILVIEDEEDIRTIVVTRLKMAGY